MKDLLLILAMLSIVAPVSAQVTDDVTSPLIPLRMSQGYTPSASLSQPPPGLFGEMGIPEGRKKKSVVQAALYSFVLPGMGELYMGEYGGGKYFTIGEGALWLTWTSFRIYGAWVQKDARNYAISHAGSFGTEGDDQYYIDIGNFNNVDEYNAEVLRGRDLHKTYDRNSPEAWAWDSDANRERYRQLRVSSDVAFNNSNFVLAAILVNHVASAVNAVRKTISHNASLDDEASLFDVHASVLGGIRTPHGIMISFTRQF